MPIPRRTLFGKLNTTLFRAIESATAFCKLRGNPYVELVHWLHQLWQTPNTDWHRLCQHYQIDPAIIERDLARSLALLPAGASAIHDFSFHIEQAIERAWILASLACGDRKIRGAWLLAALATTPELRRLLLGISSAFDAIPVDAPLAAWSSWANPSLETDDSAQDATDLSPVEPGESSAALTPSSNSALASYCQDLTEAAKNGAIDPVVGRHREIRTMIDILLRRRQNNPLLTGEAGVGKTALVEGLALAIANRTVPPSLESVRLLSLDVGALIAGASMRGEFESRLKRLLHEAGQSPRPIILFIDEIHTLIGAGGQAGTGDAANLLKPALARGSLRTIGATTWSEYKRHIEKDPALTRRFQVLQVAEPDESQAVAMLRGLAPVFARHHGVVILDEAIDAAVRLSHRYIPSRQLPDKAISLLDTASARVAMSLCAPPETVEYLQQRLAAIDAERQLLQQGEAIGKTTSDRLTTLTAEKTALTEQLSERSNRWQHALQLARTLAEKRALLLAAADASHTTADDLANACPEPTEASATDLATLKSEAVSLEAALRAWQGDQPLLHVEVDADIVADVVAQWTGIPVGRMVKDDITAVVALEAELNQRVMGQDAALATIARQIRTARAGLADPKKPIGVFLLTGPSGVGKTETALALAEALYGGEHNLITINMSEFQESHTISTLKGSPPGYVGYGEGGVLTEAVRRRPYSVVLLDEIEKAHSDVHELFYQVFDKGQMEDGEGRLIDFKNTLILLTSNVGSATMEQLCDDPALIPETDAITEALTADLRQVFPAAFLARLMITPFLPLSGRTLNDISQLQLNRLADRVRSQQGLDLRFDQAVIDEIAHSSGSHEAGARRITRRIERDLLPRLADLWLDHRLSGGEPRHQITIAVDDGQLICQF